MQNSTGESEHGLFVSGAVCSFRFKGELSALTHDGAENFLFETGNHLTMANQERERVAPLT